LYWAFRLDGVRVRFVGNAPMFLGFHVPPYGCLCKPFRHSPPVTVAAWFLRQLTNPIVTALPKPGVKVRLPMFSPPGPDRTQLFAVGCQRAKWALASCRPGISRRHPGGRTVVFSSFHFADSRYTRTSGTLCLTLALHLTSRAYPRFPIFEFGDLAAISQAFGIVPHIMLAQCYESSALSSLAVVRTVS